MSRSFTPRPYQKLAIQHIVGNRRCALWMEMGLGKTASVLAALEFINKWIEDVYPALVIAPLRVAETTWPEEVAKWDEFKHLRVSPVTGDLNQRMKALKTPADIYAINYEQIPWLVGLYGTKWPFITIAGDESTRLKSFRIRQGGVRAKELYKVAWPYCTRFIELTGTPSPKGLTDLHGQIYFLDQGERLGRTFTSFEQRWFRRSWDGFGLDPLPHARDEIIEALQDICLSIRAQDWLDVKKPIGVPVYIDLPPEARRLYNQMERDLFVTIEQEGIEAFNAASKRLKCMQMANGAIYTDDKNWKPVHDEKIKALESIIEEAAGAPILVAYHFKHDLERLRKAFPKGRVLDTKPSTIKDWNAGKISLLFAHPASAGHGLNLQYGGNILVYFAHSDNLENHLQILERIGPVRQLQAGFDRPVFVYNIVARDTVESDAVLPNLQGKGELQDLLMERMRRCTNRNTK